eukprot:COSAG01_NODE_19420_length_1010_cov_1.712404_1_plen_200_part_01
MLPRLKCCRSGAPPPFEAEEGVPPATVRELTQHARAAGISSDAILDAQDSEDPAAALGALLGESSLPYGLGIHSAAADAALREELAGMGLRELARWLREAGVDSDSILDAQGGENPKMALIGLATKAAAGNVSPTAAAAAAEQAEQERTGRRAEALQGLKVSELLRRARLAGVAQEEMDAAADSDSQRDALVGLVMEAEE